jgi:hypothetical protein
MSKEKITETEFLELLEKHDWYYSSSDDRRSYERGLEEEEEILTRVVQNPKWLTLYIAKRKEVFKII